MKLVPTVLLLALVVGFTPLLGAQNSCPVSVTDVRNIDSRILVLFTNTSGKQINDYQFGLQFYDLNGAAHPYPENFKAIAHVASLKRFMGTWHSTRTLQFLYPRAQAYLIHATFNDGTSWTDDGSHSCGITAEEE